MKLKKLLAGFFLCIATALVLGGVSAQAASKKITLTPSTTKETFEYLVVYVSTPIKEDNIASIEYKPGKIKKAADKYWKDAETESWFYLDEETGKTTASFWVYENGYYSVRITTKSGKKYVKSIKIKNLGVLSENSNHVYQIKKISGPSAKGNYSIIVDCMETLKARYDDFRGTKIGDTVLINDEIYVTVIDFRKLDGEGYYTSQDKYDDAVDCVVVRPKNPADLFELKEYVDLKENPDYYDFGFINRSDYEEHLVAYSDYEWFCTDSDYYVPIYYSLGTIKYIVTKNTNVKLAYVDSESGAPSMISGTDYMEIRLGKKEIKGIFVPDDVELKIFEKYDKKKFEFTNVVSEIKEIYMP